MRCPLRSCRLAAAAALLTTLAPASAANAASALARYVAQPDASYSWRIVSSGHAQSTQFIEAILTSQTWRGVRWEHQLYLILPRRLDASARAAALYIDGGSWAPGFERGTGTRPPRGASTFIRFAETLHAPVVVVREVPFEPLFGRTEDALIAYTFGQYFATRDETWPLLLPMVKSAVRAMDAAQAIARGRWGIDIEHFMVTGASKRGWTSWLVAAVDPRVTSVAPMAIDLLDMPAQIALQRATFGGRLSPQIRDFEAIGLPQRIATPAGRRLVSIVDPFSYRDSLTMPKLILLGTNDPYWPVDALRIYWSDLPQEKRVLMLPNQAHGLEDTGHIIGSLSALFRYTASAHPLPGISGTFARRSGTLELRVRIDRVPARVLAWAAASPTRDFHRARWSSHPCMAQGEAYLCRQPLQARGFTALYAEAAFEDPGYPPFSLTTLVRVASATHSVAGKATLACGASHALHDPCRVFARHVAIQSRWPGSRRAARGTYAARP